MPSLHAPIGASLFHVELIKSIAKTKERDLTVTLEDPVYLELTLEDGRLSIQGAHNIITYLDERYPYPQLLPPTPEARALARNLLALLDKNPADTLKMMLPALPKKGFFGGENPGIVDLAVAAATPALTAWSGFNTRVTLAMMP